MPGNAHTASNAEALCLTARKRAKGAPLDHAEVINYLALLDDGRNVPDPDDPPSYDWTGGAPFAGGSQMRVCDEAAVTLKACVGEALALELNARLQKANLPAEREHIVSHAVALLGCRHAFVLGLLHHTAPETRVIALRALVSRDWRNHENLDVLAPLLIDENHAVVEQLVPVMRQIGTWLKPLPAGTLPPGIVAQALELLRRAPQHEALLRIECLGYLALLTQQWIALAEAAKAMSANALLHLVSLPCIVSDHIGHLLEVAPALRDSLRTALFARFRAARAGWRFQELGLVCCFAPDAGTLELGLMELRLRASAGIEMAAFIRHDATLMPGILDAAFQSARREQVDAIGFTSLLTANPEAFAAALVAAPATREARLKLLGEILSCLPSRRDGEHHMSTLQEYLTRLAPAANRKRLSPKLDIE